MKDEGTGGFLLKNLAVLAACKNGFLCLMPIARARGWFGLWRFVKLLQRLLLIEVLPSWHTHRLLVGTLMNTANAIGFFLLGTIMQIIARVVPFEVGTGYAGAEGQALWLEFMSLVTGALGAGYLLRLGVQEMSVVLSRFALRRAEAREQFEQGARAQQAMPLGVRVRF
ncbi:MAG: hypothetical protein QM760_02680 [Nibricoccus sp.]